MLALNKMLSTFAAERWRLQHGARSEPTAIDRYLLPTCTQGTQQQTPRPPLLLSIDGTDRRMPDGQTNKQTDGHPTVT